MRLTRRDFLQATSAAGLLALVPRSRLLALVAAATEPGGPGHFLDAQQLATLRALAGRFIPGPLDEPGPLNAPPEQDPGAREGRCAEAIDTLLAAFSFDPPMIHAGGPFSDRAGSRVDDFATFVALDPHAALGWRIRLEGTRGIREREFAGPMTGLQEIYVSGLARLDARSRSMYGVDFAGAPGAQQDVILIDAADNPGDDLNGFVTTAFANTTDAMYGPPEYGGNHQLSGWRTSGFDGDVQPRGYTPAQVSEPDPGTPLLQAADGRSAVRFLHGLRGRPASRTQPWLGLPGFNRG